MASQDRASLVMADYDGESSTFSFGLNDVNVSNIVEVFTDLDTMRAAVAGITDGLLLSQLVSIPSQFASVGSKSTDSNSQRENKWLVTYEDVTEYLNDPVNTIRNAGYRKVFTIEIPTADLSLREGGSNVVYDVARDPENIVVFETFVSILEQMARSPYGGAINVLKMEAVGRNI